MGLGVFESKQNFYDLWASLNTNAFHTVQCSLLCFYLPLFHLYPTHNDS